MWCVCVCVCVDSYTHTHTHTHTHTPHVHCDLLRSAPSSFQVDIFDRTARSETNPTLKIQDLGLLESGRWYPYLLINEPDLGVVPDPKEDPDPFWDLVHLLVTNTGFCDYFAIH